MSPNLDNCVYHLCCHQGTLVQRGLSPNPVAPFSLHTPPHLPFWVHHVTCMTSFLWVSRQHVSSSLTIWDGCSNLNTHRFSQWKVKVRRQGSSQSRPWVIKLQSVANSCPFLQTRFYCNTGMFIHLCIVYGSFPVTTAELSGCNRECMALKA